MSATLRSDMTGRKRGTRPGSEVRSEIRHGGEFKVIDRLSESWERRS